MPTWPYMKSLLLESRQAFPLSASWVMLPKHFRRRAAKISRGKLASQQRSVMGSGRPLAMSLDQAIITLHGHTKIVKHEGVPEGGLIAPSGFLAWFNSLTRFLRDEGHGIGIGSAGTS